MGLIAPKSSFPGHAAYFGALINPIEQVATTVPSCSVREKARIALQYLLFRQERTKNRQASSNAVQYVKQRRGRNDCHRELN
jgi:hypothetical protein